MSAPLNLFVAGLAASTSELELRDTFGKYGAIESAKIMIDPNSGISKGFGFVLFTNASDGHVALKELNGKLMGTATLQIHVSEHDGRSEQSTRIYVRNLPAALSNDEIAKFFEQFGEITDVNLCPDTCAEANVPAVHQQATINYTTRNAAKKAIEETHGKRPWGMMPRPLLTKYAESSQFRASRRVRKTSNANSTQNTINTGPRNSPQNTIVPPPLSVQPMLYPGSAPLMSFPLTNPAGLPMMAPPAAGPGGAAPLQPHMTLPFPVAPQQFQPTAGVPGLVPTFGAPIIPPAGIDQMGLQPNTHPATTAIFPGGAHVGYRTPQGANDATGGRHVPPSPLAAVRENPHIRGGGYTAKN